MTTEPEPTLPITYNWIVEAKVGSGSVLLWVEDCAKPEDANQKARTQMCLIGIHSDKLVIDGEPVNMGAD